MLRIRDETDWWWKDPFKRDTKPADASTEYHDMSLVEYSIKPKSGVAYPKNFKWELADKDVAAVMDGIFVDDAAYMLHFTNARYYEPAHSYPREVLFKYRQWTVQVNTIYIVGERQDDGLWIPPNRRDWVIADYPEFNTIEDALQKAFPNADIDVDRGLYHSVRSPSLSKQVWKHDSNKKGLDIGTWVYYAHDNELHSSKITTATPSGTDDVLYTLENGEQTLFSQSPIVRF